jgi:hypothetical protein
MASETLNPPIDLYAQVVKSNNDKSRLSVNFYNNLARSVVLALLSAGIRPEMVYSQGG